MNKIVLLITAVMCLSHQLFSQQKALLFDGVDDRVVVANHPDFNNTNALTLEAWIYANNWKSQIFQGTIIGHDASNSSGYALRCGENGKLNFVIGNGSWPEISSGPIMASNTWNHVAAVLDNGKAIIYINGTAIDSMTVNPAPIASTTNLFIGESSGFAGRVFDGAIDEVRIWNVARTAAQIDANKTINLPSGEPGLIAYYQFNQISGNTTPNTMSTANTEGTLFNFGSNPWVDGYSVPANDLSASSLISPDVISVFSKLATKVKIGIENKGIDPVSSYQVGYQLNGGVWTTENVSQNLNPGDATEHTFSELLFDADSISTIQVFASAAGDDNTNNDTLTTNYIKPSGGNIHTVNIFDGELHNFGAAGQSHFKTVSFPDANVEFSEILMHINLRCPGGGCDPWDQPAKISLLKDGDRYELGRFVTPYGIACGPWTIDITSFKSVLQGACQIESYIQVWGQSGWLLDLDIEFVEGTTQYPYQKLSPLWDTDNWVYGDPNISYDLPVQNVLVNNQTKETEFRMTITGHGQANTDNAAEFSPKTHVVRANGAMVNSHYLWKTDCAQNPCTNQQGTYTYSRAGWCPGQSVDPHFVDLTPQMTPGSTITIDYVLQSYTNLLNTGYNGSSHTEPHYKIHAYLVEKSDNFIGDNNYKNAALMAITYPANQSALSGSTEVKVMITNSGATTITTADLAYYLDGIEQVTETATLNLAPGASMEYTFSQNAAMNPAISYLLTVSINANDDALSDDVISIELGDFVSIEENTLSQINVFPNPSQGSFWISGFGNESKLELQLTNISGKQVLSKTITGDQLKSPYLLEGTYNTGVYLLKIKGKTQSTVRKLIVN